MQPFLSAKRLTCSFRDLTSSSECMSVAAASTASKLDLALQIWKPKGKAKAKAVAGAPSSFAVASEKQAEQKRQAAKRDRILARAPDHVKAKWDSILQVKGRDHGKNMLKAKYMEALFAANGSYTDVYWEQSVTDKYIKKQSRDLNWMLRSRAEVLHGGGQLAKRRSRRPSTAACTSARCTR